MNKCQLKHWWRGSATSLFLTCPDTKRIYWFNCCFKSISQNTAGQRPPKRYSLESFNCFTWNKGEGQRTLKALKVTDKCYATSSKFTSGQNMPNRLNKTTSTVICYTSFQLSGMASYPTFASEKPTWHIFFSTILKQCISKTDHVHNLLTVALVTLTLS